MELQISPFGSSKRPLKESVGDMSYNMPCKDCQKREVGCHSKCKEYAQATEIRNALLQSKCAANIATDYLKGVYVKNKTHYMKRHKKH